MWQGYESAVTRKNIVYQCKHSGPHILVNYQLNSREIRDWVQITLVTWFRGLLEKKLTNSCARITNLKTKTDLQYLCSYPTPPPWAGGDTRSIFMQNTVGLSSPSPRQVALLKLKKPVCPTIYS